jgi:hypothetical protein
MIDEPVVISERSVTKPSSFIGGEPAHILEEQHHLEQHVRLGLPAGELDRCHRLVDLGETEASPRGLAVDRQQGHAVARGRSKRVLPQAALGGGEAVGVVVQLRGEAAGPERNGARHRRLLVGIPRKQRRGFSLPKGVECRGHGESSLAQRLDFVAQVEAQSRQDLVIAGAAQV